jgi:hypothetical protein
MSANPWSRASSSSVIVSGQVILLAPPHFQVSFSETMFMAMNWDGANISERCAIEIRSSVRSSLKIESAVGFLSR